MSQTNQAIELDGERLSPPPPAASPAVSAVLENEDLVGEILLRLAFPTTLVRAALACRRWLRVASDPSFLRRFRELHPPRLLGFYVTSLKIPRAHPLFVPMPPAPARPPELDPVVLRRGDFSLAYEGHTTSIFQCRNGSILLFKERHDRRELKHAVHRPLQHPERGLLAIPFSSTHDDDDDVEPDLGFDDENVWGFHFGEDGGSQLYRLSVMFTPRGATSAWFYAFRDGGWHVQTKATAQLPGLPPEGKLF